MAEIKQEQEFLKRLQEVLTKARKRGGFLSEDELRESFADLALSDEQLRQVREYLTANKIGIGEALPVSEVLTEEEHNYLEDYLEMIRQIPQLTAGELDALKLRAMAGDAASQSQLAEVMLAQVVDIAKLYAGQDVLIEDLIGTGNEALMRGVKLLAPLEEPSEVDGALGRRIMDAMEDLIAQRIDERASDKEMEDLVNLVADRARELSQLLGRKVSAEELAHEGEVELESILEAVRLSGNTIEELEN